MGAGQSCPGAEDFNLESTNELLKLKLKVQEKLGEYTRKIDELEKTIERKDAYIAQISVNYDGDQAAEFLKCGENVVTCDTHTSSVENAATSARESVKVLDGSEDRDIKLQCEENEEYNCNRIKNIMKYDNVHTYPQRLEYIEDKLYLRECDTDPHLNRDRKSCTEKGHQWVNKYYCWNNDTLEKKDEYTDLSSCQDVSKQHWVMKRQDDVQKRFDKLYKDYQELRNKMREQNLGRENNLKDWAYMHVCDGDTSIDNRKDCTDNGHTWREGLCPGNMTLTTDESCEAEGHTWVLTKKDYYKNQRDDYKDQRDLLYNKLCNLPGFDSCYPINMDAANAFEVKSDTFVTAKSQEDITEQSGKFDTQIQLLKENIKACPSLVELKMAEDSTLSTECRTDLNAGNDEQKCDGLGEDACYNLSYQCDWDWENNTCSRKATYTLENCNNAAATLAKKNIPVFTDIATCMSVLGKIPHRDMTKEEILLLKEKEPDLQCPAKLSEEECTNGCVWKTPRYMCINTSNPSDLEHMYNIEATCNARDDHVYKTFPECQECDTWALKPYKENGEWKVSCHYSNVHGQELRQTYQKKNIVEASDGEKYYCRGKTEEDESNHSCSRQSPVNCINVANNRNGDRCQLVNIKD